MDEGLIFLSDFIQSLKKAIGISIIIHCTILTMITVNFLVIQIKPMRKESITCNYSKINSQVKHPGFQGLCSMLTIQQFIRLNQKLVIASLYPCQPVLEIYPLLKFRVLSHGDKDVCPSFFLLCRQIINSFITPPTPLNRI